LKSIKPFINLGVKGLENKKMEEFDEITERFGLNEKKNPFIVPEGYFEKFSDGLHERMHVLDGKSRFTATHKILRPSFVYISGFCLLIIAAISVTYISLDHRSSQLNSKLYKTTLLQYSLENVDEQTIIDALPKAAFESTASEITKEEVVNYLQEQNIDLNLANEEL
jgi:hypothetical protein